MNGAIVVLLIAILLVMIVGISVLVKKPVPQQNITVDTRALSDTVYDLAQKASHYIEVTSISALFEDFDENPDLIENLSKYSRQIVSAALLVRINQLGSDITSLQDTLSVYRENVSNYPLSAEWADRLLKLEQHEAMLFSQLFIANRAAETFRNPTVLSK